MCVKAQGTLEHAQQAAAESAEEKAAPANGEEGSKESQASTQQQPSEEDPVEAAFSELKRWVDCNEAQYAVLSAKREARLGRPAIAIK